MISEAMFTKHENDQKQDVEALSEVGITAEAFPVDQMRKIIAEANALSDGDDIYCKNLITLAFKITELENRLVKLEIINHPC